MIIFGTLLQMRMHDKWEFKQKVEYINHAVMPNTECATVLRAFITI